MLTLGRCCEITAEGFWDKLQEIEKKNGWDWFFYIYIYLYMYTDVSPQHLPMISFLLQNKTWVCFLLKSLHISTSRPVSVQPGPPVEDRVLLSSLTEQLKCKSINGRSTQSHGIQCWSTRLSYCCICWCLFRMISFRSFLALIPPSWLIFFLFLKDLLL